MKRIIVAATMLMLTGTASVSAHHRTDVTLRVFHESLSPYGDWVRWNGIDVWRPLMVSGTWQPYTAGRWAWTGDGWYWVSDEPWGWATYHYGRWHYDDYYGWVWLPDYEWAPAWVHWRCGGGYAGWAPMGPRLGIHITLRFGPPLWARHDSHWTFVHYSHLTHHQVRKHFLPKDETRRYFGATRDAGNTRHLNGRLVTAGPDIAEVERTGRVRVQRIDLDRSGRPETRERERADNDRSNGRTRVGDSDRRSGIPDKGDRAAEWNESRKHRGAPEPEQDHERGAVRTPGRGR